MAGNKPQAKSQVKNDQENTFLHFNMDEIPKLAREKKCPVCQKSYSRLHPVKKPNGKYYIYADHNGKTLHYVAPLTSYDYVINNIRAMYYLYKSGMFSKEQLTKLIYDVFELIATEAKEDEKFRKIIVHSLKQLIEKIGGEENE